MSYLVAAYGLTLATLVVYGWMLQRERGRLERNAGPDASDAP